MEQLLLGAAIKSRKAWAEADALLEPTDLAPMAKLVWTEIGQYYERDKGADGINLDNLGRLLESRFTNPKHFDLCKRLLTTIPSDVSPDNVVELVREHRKVKVGLLLAQALSTNSKAEIEKCLSIYGSLSQAQDSAASPISPATTLAELVQSRTTAGSTIALAPKSLNDVLENGLERGHVVLVYARPETGKTLFLVNALCGFLAQGLRVLYLGNEEPLRITLLRVISRLSLLPKAEVLANPSKADTLSLSAGYQNLYASYSSGMTCEWVERAVKQIKPDVVIVDQMRNVIGQDDNRVMQLDKVARKLREIAGAENVLMLYTTQAGDSASGKLVLDMGDVDFSNTGIPGAVDLMIGIGMNDEYERMGQRMLSLPKNKVSGNHGFLAVQFDTQLSKVSSI